MTNPRQATVRYCACGGAYLDDGLRAPDWGRHSKTRQHRRHESRFEDAGQMPVNEPAVFRGYPND